MKSPVTYLGAAILLFIAEMFLALMSASLSLRLAFGILALHYAWKACTCRDGSAHPIGLYLLVSGIYVFAALVEVALLGNRLDLDPILMGDLADMGVGFLICTAFGFLVFREKVAPPPQASTVDGIMVQTTISVCTALMVICAVMIFYIYGFSIGGLSRSDIYSEESGILSLMRGLLAIGLGMGAAILTTYEKRIGYKLNVPRIQLFSTLAVYVMLDLLVLGDRRLPLMALLAVGTHFLPRRFTWPQVLGAAFLAIALFAYGFVRNTPPSGWLPVIMSGDIFLAFSPASTEFGGLSIIGQAIGNFDHRLMGFPVYSDAFLQIMPSWILDNRPLSPTEWFIQSYYPDLAAAGASYAFNQVIEARMNAGIFGVIAAGFLTGSAIAVISRFRYLGVPFGVSLAVYIFSFSIRMDFASILRTLIVASIGTALTLGIASFVRSSANIARRQSWVV